MHYLADLLATDNKGVTPRVECVRVLDIGVGANVIYPLIGHREYGWQFVGTDVDVGALKNAQRIVDANNLSPPSPLGCKQLQFYFSKALLIQTRFLISPCATRHFMPL